MSDMRSGNIAGRETNPVGVPYPEQPNFGEMAMGSYPSQVPGVEGGAVQMSGANMENIPGNLGGEVHMSGAEMFGEGTERAPQPVQGEVTGFNLQARQEKAVVSSEVSEPAVDLELQRAQQVVSEIAQKIEALGLRQNNSTRNRTAKKSEIESLKKEARATVGKWRDEMQNPHAFAQALGELRKTAAVLFEDPNELEQYVG